MKTSCNEGKDETPNDSVLSSAASSQKRKNTARLGSRSNLHVAFFLGDQKESDFHGSQKGKNVVFVAFSHH